MADKGPSMSDSLMSGVDLTGIREQYGPTSGNDLVTIEEWQVCVGPNGLIESCTVTPKDPSHAVTGIGLLVYSSDGTSLYCSQYTDGFTGASILASVSTGSSDLKAGANVLAVVFGY